MTPLILLHGALGSASQMTPLAQLLAGSRPVHVLDFENHGSGQRVERLFRIENFIENVLSLIHDASLGQVDLFGYDFGGNVALELALGYPELVRRLAVFGTKVVWDPDVGGIMEDRMWPDEILATGAIAATELESRHALHDWRDICANTREMYRYFGNRQQMTFVELGRLQIPLRVIMGDRDDQVMFGDGLGLYHAAQNAQFEALPNTPHAFERTNLARLSASLNEFFA